MKTVFTLLLFSLHFICPSALFSQDAGKRIINVKTAEHVTLPGHDLFLKLPGGYQRAPHFSGWQHKNGSLLVLSKKQKTLNEALAEVELRLKEENYLPGKKNLRVNNDNAVLITSEGTADPSLKKNILLIEKNGYIYIVEGKSTGAKEQNDILMKSILTSFIEN